MSTTWMAGDISTVGMLARAPSHQRTVELHVHNIRVRMVYYSVDG